MNLDAGQSDAIPSGIPRVSGDEPPHQPLL